MRRASIFLLTVSGIWTGAASAAPVLSRDDDVPAYRFPVIPGVPGPGAMPGSRGIAESRGQDKPGVTSPLVPPPKPAPGSESTAATPAARLDDLFQRLARADDSDEADGLAHAIERLWLQSGSDTADLLMVRAVSALGKGENKIALDLLDKIVVVAPEWVEAWNKRATLRFLKGDDVGSMQDVAEVLAREPRHFGALSGMAFILQRNGMDKQALDLVRRTQAIYPHNTSLEKLGAELILKVEGRDI